mmetsp:Transcript_29682/g.40145  ORF Transcript_29682/g.40145 Transcript_29682/m.40145 type:complete len:101 (+) Transcript_29682:130-432(+)
MEVMCEDIDLNFAISDQDVTPFMLACYLANLCVVHLLHKNKSIEKKKTDKRGYNCFHYAVMGGCLELVKFLKEQGVPYISSTENVSPLHLATESNRLDIV